MLTLRVRSITYEAEGILSFELVDPRGAELPAFDAGAHIDVHVPGGLTRRYSLCDPPWERDHYRIAVLDVPHGRGGSRAMHERVHAGDLIEVSEPHNFFPVAPDARHAILLAGGIGITPIMAMVAQMRRAGQSFELHYCAQTPERTAFTRRFASEIEAGRARLHHDGGDPRRGLDIASVLASPGAGTHLYFCGPGGFMSAVRAAAEHWPQGTVHFEYFGADPSPSAAATTTGGPEGAEVVLERSNRTLRVDPSQSILQAVRDAGIECESSCEAGMCGTCRVRYVGGTPEHNDYVLSDEERREFVLICCARVAQGPLVLDL
ncbi:Phthalate dioxygenase reductase [Variovorax sp. SRS16]|uniref:PDR/VanB family oxidoreductase n=1 Tax=Variovorax sp. SRS16 TaxID=282217 RepID=UPI001317C059|nr:PDR/VanB family oxidoreductase [Variovorax sp. SRS16]VTU22305.1 Phthalate dioxygenase reductase [Variovorax sp. SRS16]